MSALEIHNLNCGYNSKIILKNISLSAEEGEFVGILGPNGCGKTTLLRAIIRAIPVLNGEIKLSGMNINNMSRPDLARQVSLVPQLSEIIEGFTVKEIVAMGRTPHLGRFSLFGEKDMDITEEAMVLTNVKGLESRDISALSGGEYQRAIIARSLAQGSNILLLDEPTSHLDIKYQIEILELLKKLKGKTVISTFHDLRLAGKYCSRLILIKEGRIVSEGAPLTILTPQTISSVYDIDPSFEICL